MVLTRGTIGIFIYLFIFIFLVVKDVYHFSQ